MHYTVDEELLILYIQKHVFPNIQRTHTKPANGVDGGGSDFTKVLVDLQQQVYPILL